MPFSMEPSVEFAAVGGAGMLETGLRSGAVSSGSGTFADKRGDFARILARSNTLGSGKDPEQARTAAQEFVSMSLVQPLLAQMRTSNHAAAPFAPTSGEAQFQQMLDAHMAQNIVRAKQFPLVDAVARKLLGKKETEPESPIVRARSRIMTAEQARVLDQSV